MLSDKSVSFKSLQSDVRYIPSLQTDGNHKLIDTDKIHNMRWNLPAVSTCPYATPHCIRNCYAKRDERYANVKASRQDSYAVSLGDDFVNRMIYTIETNLTRPKFRGKKVFFRIHESGDFYSLDYLVRWLQVVAHFQDNKQITFICYTKSIDYFMQLGFNSSEDIKSIYPNFIISLSIWDDTPEDIKAVAPNYKTYTALSPEDIKARQTDKTFHHCKCFGCGSSCKACMTYAIKSTACAIH